MIDVHAIANSAIQRVNADITATLQRSTGYVTSASGKQVPKFTTLRGAIQLQGLSARDLEHTELLNIQGVLRAVYILGNWAGVVRADQKGGDVMQFPQTPSACIQCWRIVMVRETWPNWCSVVVALQS